MKKFENPKITVVDLTFEAVTDDELSRIPGGGGEFG